ncbi:sugar phosphate nucleotidyltransferase [Paenibacillus glycanilyticus]|uniref:mannose-1-phosphate guanylyltransferase n=1 Tax=Paenibacillus glycanilyticus TaxID=126569 RepID=UPI00203B4D03|nr:sugar phosphate nucleotidyltransferase [Paenibacillus glycanilyticus]MCM3626011.1 sugar phosphate nucleotidyltransferase [Paenibacillus glycanilyticus]
MIAVIMAGGKGTRFWPRSTVAKPKQFLTLASEEATMLQQTYERFRSYLPEENVYVAVSENYLPIVREQLPELGENRIIIEPDQRDTAPCIALTASYFMKLERDEVLVTAPSDQYIPDTEELMEALRAAEQAASHDGVVVTLGIVPTRAETGYGYIETIENVQHKGKLGDRIKEVKAFIEKPTKEKAEKLIEQPNMYWNSGIFIWKPSTIAGYMMKYQPQMWSIFDLKDEDFLHSYARLQKLSIDYALVEKLERLYTIPIEFVWDDVGTWTSLERIFSTDGDGNLLHGSIYPFATRNTIIYTEQQLIVAIGVEDLIIVSTVEGLLICRKSDEQNVKHAIAAITADQEGRQG